MKKIIEYTNYSYIEVEVDSKQEAIDIALSTDITIIQSNAEGWGFNKIIVSDKE